MAWGTHVAERFRPMTRNRCLQPIAPRGDAVPEDDSVLLSAGPSQKWVQVPLGPEGQPQTTAESLLLITAREVDAAKHALQHAEAQLELAQQQAETMAAVAQVASAENDQLKEAIATELANSRAADHARSEKLRKIKALTDALEGNGDALPTTKRGE